MIVERAQLVHAVFPSGQPVPLVLDDFGVLELLQHASADELAAARGGDTGVAAMLHKRADRLRRGTMGLRPFKVGRSSRYALGEVLDYTRRQTELER